MDNLLEKCEKLYGHDEHALERLCNEILESDNDNEIALSYKAAVYCNWHQYHLAIDLLEKIHALYPQNYWAFYTASCMYMGKKDFENALLSCNEGLAIKSINPLKINKISALLCLERFDEAHEFYKNSKVCDYTFTNALIDCGKYSKVHDYEIELSDTELVESYLKRCKCLYNGWNRSEILDVCSEIFKIDPTNNAAMGYMIFALGCLDRHDEALLWSDKAISLYPDDYYFYFEKADTLLWAFKDYDGAIKSLEKGFLLVENPERYWHEIDNMVYALENKADTLLNSEKTAEPIEVYDRILFYRPNEFKALEKIEELGIEYDSENYRKSLKLRQNSRQRSKKIDDFLNGIEIGEFDDEYINGCGKFKDYKCLEEYIRDIIICLMGTYPYNSEESSRFLVKCHLSDIKSSYEYNEPAAYCSIDVGYCCG